MEIIGVFDGAAVCIGNSLIVNGYIFCLMLLYSIFMIV